MVDRDRVKGDKGEQGSPRTRMEMWSSPDEEEPHVLQLQKCL